MDEYKTRIDELFTELIKNKYCPMKYLNDFLKTYDHVIIFGAGEIGKTTAKIIDMVCGENQSYLFCDNDRCKNAQMINGKSRCITIEELRKFTDENTVILVSTRHYKEIVSQIKTMDFHNVYPMVSFLKFMNPILHEGSKAEIQNIKNQLSEVIGYLDDEKSKNTYLILIENLIKESPFHTEFEKIYTENQYFTDELIHIGNKEVFIDGGAFDGATSLEFIKNSANLFSSIHMFELAEENYKKIDRNLESLAEEIRNKIHLHRVGLWDREDVLSCQDETSQGAKISLNGLKKVFVNSLDNIFGTEEISFLKLDIEGAEMKALKGSSNLIRKYKPKLAICIYHKIEDLWEIPKYLKELVPEYKIYIRQHTMTEQETVCYAIIR